jgi:hypothetical protein
MFINDQFQDSLSYEFFYTMHEYFFENHINISTRRFSLYCNL